MSKKRDSVATATGRSHAPNRTFVAYPKAEDEPVGIRVRSHADYAAQLEAERLAAGADWFPQSQEFFARLQGRG